MLIDLGDGLYIDPEQQLRELDRCDFEDSLYMFLRAAWSQMDSAPWKDGWPIEAVAEHLQAVVDGEIKRLLVNLPPRLGKSSICSVAFPAWIWAQAERTSTSGPGVPILGASYSHSLALRDSVRCRRLIESPWYQSMWGARFAIAGDQNTKTRFQNTEGGERLITSVDAGVTGEGGNCFVAGTMVSTPSGQREIEVLSAGDRVLAFDHLTGKMVTSRVIATKTRKAQDIATLHTIGGHSIKCTPDHPIYSPGRGYVAAVEVGAGDGLIVTRGAHNASSRDLRQLRSPYRKNAIRGAQGAQAGQSRRVLFQGMLLHASRHQELKAVSRLRWSQGAPHQILLPCMSSFLERFPAPLEILPSVSGAIQTRQDVLLSRLREQGSLRTDAWREQFQLYGDRALLQPIRTDAGCDHGARPVQMLRLREGGLRIRGASHRRKYTRQQARELDFVVRQLPPQAPSWNADSISHVTRTSGVPVDVYDIQVEGQSNFFANGILVHNCIILDDPNAANEVSSEATIQRTLDWWDGTMSTRLNDAKTGAFVVVQQRLAENDLSGHILEKNQGDWVHLMLPMRYEPERAFVNGYKWKDPREVDGELLWPERFGEPEVKALERALGPYGASGQLQQSPSPRGGGIIKREWWQLWGQDKFPPMDYILGVVDTAYTEKQENDPSAMIVLGVFTYDPVAQISRVIGADGRPLFAERTIHDPAPKIILMNAWAERLPLHELVTKINTTARTFKLDKLIIENKASGISVSQELRRLFSNEQYATQLIDPKSLDKMARLYSVQHIFAEGMVYAPDRAWADKVITEVALFPKAKHDDLTDCVSSGIRHLRDLGMLTRSQERLEEIAQSAQYHGAPPQPLYPG